jgi:hypothetical protein
MTRFLLAIGAGLLSAHAAYAQLPHCPSACTDTDISKLVCSLKMPYDPSAPYNPSNPVAPMCDTSVPLPPGTLDTIKKAFLATNKVGGLQKCICALTNIFVTTDASNSWGKWLNPQGGGGGARQYSRAAATGADNAYIALNVSDLNTTVPQQQDARLAGLQIAAGVASHSETNNSGIDSGTLAALYALAHEMAHLSWRRDNGSFRASCNLVKMAKSWADGSKANSWAKRPWTTYGNMSFGQRGSNTPPSPQNANAGTLQTIYKSGVVTALGAANPEEDFVESYAMETINLAAGNTSTSTNYTLNINITGSSPIKVNLNRNSDVQFKFTCVDNVLQ